MVSEGILSRTSTRSSSPAVDNDGISLSSSNEGTIALRNSSEIVPSFGNISVANSSDVHFGNKTFYQGPVTIKQFLYANGQLKIEDDADLDANNDSVANERQRTSFEVDGDGNLKDSNEVSQESHSEIRKGFKRLQKFLQENFTVLVSLLSIFMVCLMILIVVLLVRHAPKSMDEDQNTFLPKGDTNEQDKSQPIDDAALDPSLNLTLPDKLKLVTRLEWVAQPPVKPATPLQLPVPYVIIMHTATENCSTHAQCIFHVRYIQMFHIESQDWWDIGYNFLVGGDGEAYEGRGWTSEGAHTFGYNSRSIGIALIGTFNNFMPPARQILACKRLIQKGVENGYISKNYKLLGAKQLQTTASPGTVLFEDIQKWDHWAKQP